MAVSNQAAVDGSMTAYGRARLFVLLGGLTAFGPLSIDMYLPALPAIGKDLAASESLIQLTLVMGLAPILAPVVGAQLLRFTSWHGIFLVLALITALLWLGAASALPETLPVERRRSGSLGDTVRTFRKLAADTQFISYAVAGGLAFGAMFAYIAGSPFVLQGIYRVSPQTFSLIFGLNALGFVITSQINGSLVGRIPPARLLTVGVTVTGAAGLALL